MSVGYKVIKVDSPWKETDVTVFDGDIVPIVTANILASTIGLKGFLEKKSPKDLIDGDGIYKSKNGKIVKCLCTLEGILLFMKQCRKWDNQEILDRARLQFRDEDRIMSVSVMDVPKKNPKRVFEETLELLQEVKAENQKLRQFVLDVVLQSGAYKEMIDQRIEERVKAVEETIRKELEPKILEEQKAIEKKRFKHFY